MVPTKIPFVTFAAIGLAVLASARPCAAHFLWLKVVPHDDKPHAFLFFGENAQDEAYHLPEALADSKVWRRSPGGERAEISVKAWTGDDRIGLGAPLADDKPCILEASGQYGVYGTALLVYSAKHIHASSEEQLNAAGGSKKLKLDIVPRVVGNQLELTLTWDGKPLAGAKTSLTVGDAEEAIEKNADNEGHVTFKPTGEGILSILTSRMDKSLSGELNGKPYDHSLHYASLTLDWPVSRKPEVDRTSAKPQVTVPPLPEPLSSFGAVAVDGWLYVYGGHTGTEHDHSASNLSNYFRRVQIEGGDEWEDLPMQTPLQGLPLVAHDGKVYRVGGMSARNATTDEDEDLHSTAEFAEFDPATNQWTALASLPAGRSSHNAVVIGDRLYVVGGWSLSGTPPGKWQEHLLVYDFARPQAGWQEVSKQPFRRRALAAGQFEGKLVALGGLDEDGDVSQQVDIFDFESGEWTAGPELPGEAPAGFGISAWNLNGRLYVSGLRGLLYRLNQDASEWDEAAQLAKPRFFHQLVPADGDLLAVGGASRKGHMADIEWIDVDE